MTKRTYITLGILATVGVVSLLLLRSYELELVQNIVLHALIQKSPAGVSDAEIERLFQRSLTLARLQQRESEYMADLIRLSQKLEKLQSIDEPGLRQLLSTFTEKWTRGRRLATER